jgi:endonuclease YncB( thermonuclease family)
MSCSGGFFMFRKSARSACWLVLVAILLLPWQGRAHRGRLDSLGCHPSYSRVLAGPTVGYHCHWGVLSGREFASREEALKALEELREGSSTASEEITWHTVTGVPAGSTVVLDGKDEVVLLGVDSLESADEAIELIRRLVGGNKVRLESDQETKDHDGVALAYVYTEAGILLNSEAIRQGHARVATEYSFSFEEEFRRYEREARRAKRGLWGKTE